MSDWQNDPYALTWFKGLAERTRQTYSAVFSYWLDFKEMTATEQRMKPVTEK